MEGNKQWVTHWIMKNIIGQKWPCLNWSKFAFFFHFWGQPIMELTFSIILECIYKFLKGLGPNVAQTKGWGKFYKKCKGLGP